MSSAQLQRLKEIFHSAQQLRPNERSNFLDQACGDDTELRAEIDALLKSDQAADGFMVDPPAQLAAEVFGQVETSSAVGRTIGRYKLIERIGAGGMGEVYLAERADQQFKMQVAIKLIKRGMDTESVLRRFQHERQILASLEHPNIARLLDGGETEDGLPYFVMEHVKGERIDRYAESKILSINERLELFRQVCGAVSYAHQHLVVHRDLKPSNILVTPEGVPKLLDFGIAKIMQAGDGADSFATITMMPMMTPDYASPEQIEGAHATTLSDIYSLGAVLYELLSGQPPHRLKTTRDEPPRPSTVIGQHPSAIRNQKSLRGDLDNIVLMAMRKDTARRYRSVEQFSDDIRRHLTGRPVMARPDTLSYRAAKFLKRNRLAVSAAALLFLTLVGGIMATTWQARRATMQEQRARAEQAHAERRFNEVRKLANNVLFDYHDAIKDLPGATKVRERLVKDGLTYLDSLAGEAHGDPNLQRELAAAYVRVGDVRGGLVSGSLGDLTGAIESYRKALAIRETLVAANPTDTQARRDLASNHQKIGVLLNSAGKESDALEHHRKAVSICLELTQEQPANDDFQSELAGARNDLGREMSDQGDRASALEQHRAAQAICEELATSRPRDPRYRRALLVTHNYIAYALWLQNDAPGAMESDNKAMALGEALIAEDPINADYRRRLFVTYVTGGDHRKGDDKHGALELFRKAAALCEQTLAADPANALAHKDLAYTDKKMADLLVELEDDSQALSQFDKALQGYQKVIADAPADLISAFLVATCHAGVARMRARLGEVDLALEECGQAISLLQKITGDKPGHFGRGQAHEYLGYAYAALAVSPKASASERSQHLSAARDQFRQTLDIINVARTREGDLGENETWAKAIAGQIAKCEAALGR